MNAAPSQWRVTNEELLRVTREELAIMRSPEASAFAKFIGVSPADTPSYVATLEAQERRLVRDLANPKN